MKCPFDWTDAVVAATISAAASVRASVPSAGIVPAGPTAGRVGDSDNGYRLARTTPTA